MEVEKTVETREVVTTTKVEEEFFVIKLTRDEACALQALLGSVGGWNKDVPNLRDTTDKIWSSLGHEGIDYESEEVQKYSNRIQTNTRIY
jgi:hypothetical protein